MIDRLDKYESNWIDKKKMKGIYFYRCKLSLNQLIW